MKIKELDQALITYKQKEKDYIKSINNKHKRFWLWIRYFLIITWKWLFIELRDWKTFLIFLGTVLIVGCEVWIPFLIGCFTGEKWWFGIAATCEAFWLAPFTPFLALCIAITIGIKGLVYKIKNRTKSQE